MSITRNVAIVATATLASRVLGFARDVAIAALFGASARADAFVVAFQFSNLIRRLLTEGALNSAFWDYWLWWRSCCQVSASTGCWRTTLLSDRRRLQSGWHLAQSLRVLVAWSSGTGCGWPSWASCRASLAPTWRGVG